MSRLVDKQIYFYVIYLYTYNRYFIETQFKGPVYNVYKCTRNIVYFRPKCTLALI